MSSLDNAKGHLEELEHIMETYKLPLRILNKLEIRLAILKDKVKR